MTSRGSSAKAQAGPRRSWWLSLLAGFFILNVMGAFSLLDRSFYGDWDGKQGDKITQALNLAQIVSSAVLFVRAFTARIIFGRGEILLLTLTGFLLLSTAWSIAPDVTLRRGILFLLFMIGCVGVASNMECDDFMDVTSLACCASAAVSAILLFAAPGMVLSAELGDFRGVFSHKNVLGQVMLAGSIATLHSIRAGRRRARTGYAMLALLVVVAVLSKSSTSLMATLAMCLTSGVAVLLRGQGAARTAGLWLAALYAPLLLVTVLFQGAILELLGKDPTLTGRTDLWAYVIDYIWQRPILGWGLTAFWSADNPAANEISTFVGWVVPQAHNGLLEILLETGVVGAMLFGAALVRNIRSAVGCLGTPARELGVSTLLCCFSIVLVGLTEEVLIDPSLSVAMFFILGLMCKRAAPGTEEPRPALVAARSQAPSSVPAACFRESPRPL